MKVLLRVAGRFQVADCDFGAGHDLASLARWRRQARAPRDQAAEDALEFAAIARKRWHSYTKLGRTVMTAPEIQRAIAANAESEIAMLAALRCTTHGKRRLAGFCLFRRTWCNHLIIDLLAANPAMKGHLSRVGAGLIYFVTEIAETLRAPFIWGEATKDSAEYYQTWFQTDAVDDLFRIEAARYRRFASRYREHWERSGLPVR